MFGSLLHFLDLTTRSGNVFKHIKRRSKDEGDGEFGIKDGEEVEEDLRSRRRDRAETNMDERIDQAAAEEREVDRPKKRKSSRLVRLWRFTTCFNYRKKTVRFN